MRVYIGRDERQHEAWRVAAASASRWGGVQVFPVIEQRLRTQGLITRPLDRRNQTMFDLNSGAFQSTDFAVARFFVPLLAHSGWCVFVDSDVVFMEPPYFLLGFTDSKKAVMVVKHPPLHDAGVKMDGQLQQPYQRKNWSSVMLWNCDHPANARLNLTTLNAWPGRDLHAFAWLHDEEIGELPPTWNWLVDVQPKPDMPSIAHFTLGTPDMAGHENSEHAEIWWAAAGGRQ